MIKWIMPNPKKSCKQNTRVLRSAHVKVLIFMSTSTAADHIASQDYTKINTRKAEIHYTVRRVEKI